MASGLNDFYDVTGTLTINPDQSVHYVFGDFAPSAGPVDPGTYSFYRATIGLYVTGLGVEPAGTSVSLFAVTFPYLTCKDNDASCALTRTVGAVPEPTGYTLLLCGLGAVGLLIGRRRKA